jgi:lipopolysaccharide export system permease protein
MFRIIDRYIAIEILRSFALTVLIITFIFILGNLLKLIKLVVNQGLGFMALLKLIAFVIPKILVYVFPISFFVAILLAYNRFSRDSEIIAFKTSGLSLAQLARPTIILSTVPFLTTLFLTLYATPLAKNNFKRLLYELSTSKAHLVLKEKTFIDDFEDITLFINELSVNGKDMKGVFIIDEREKEGTSIISAEKGTMLLDKNSRRAILRLTQGNIHNKGAKGELFREVIFKKYDINISPTGTGNSISQKNKGELFINELYKKIEEIKEAGGDTNSLVVHLYKRLTIPFATLVFTIIGISLSHRWDRGGKLGVFTVALTIVMLYYLLSVLFEFLGKQGILNPYFAVWGSNVVFVVFGLYSFYKSSKEQPLFNLVIIRKLTNKLSNMRQSFK